MPGATELAAAATAAAHASLHTNAAAAASQEHELDEALFIEAGALAAFTLCMLLYFKAPVVPVFVSTVVVRALAVHYSNVLLRYASARELLSHHCRCCCCFRRLRPGTWDSVARCCCQRT
jgi:hypothetical protein